MRSGSATGAAALLLSLVPVLLTGCSGDAGGSPTGDASSASRSTAAPSTSPATATPDATPDATPGATLATTVTGSPAVWPEEVPYPVEGRVWAVYVAVARDDSAAEQARMAGATKMLRSVGYAISFGAHEVVCEIGAAEALNLDPAAITVPVFLYSRGEVDQFLAAWDAPYVGFAEVTENCMA